MKNTGLKVPGKDQTYVRVGFLDNYRAKIIGKSFSTSLFQMLGS